MSEQTLTVPVPAAPPAQAGKGTPGAGNTGAKVPGRAASGAAAPATGEQGAAAPAAPAPPTPRRTPARPVVSLALVLFVPAVVLVLDGNLSVQTALVRFVAALLVSWAAARLVWATVRSATPAGAADPEASAARAPSGRAEAARTNSPARADAPARTGVQSGTSSPTAPPAPGMS